MEKWAIHQVDLQCKKYQEQNYANISDANKTTAWSLGATSTNTTTAATAAAMTIFATNADLTSAVVAPQQTTILDTRIPSSIAPQTTILTTKIPSSIALQTIILTTRIPSSSDEIFAEVDATSVETTSCMVPNICKYFVRSLDFTLILGRLPLPI